MRHKQHQPPPWADALVTPSYPSASGSGRADRPVTAAIMIPALFPVRPVSCPKERRVEGHGTKDLQVAGRPAEAGSPICGDHGAGREEVSSMPMWGWMSGWGWLVMTVMLLAFVALVVVAIVVVGWLLGPPAEPPAGDQPPGRSPVEILQERFARGEIDEEEFRRRRA